MSRVRFIARDNPTVAARVGNKLINKVAILQNFPQIGTPYSKAGHPFPRFSSLYRFLSRESERKLRGYFALLARRERRIRVLTLDP